MTNHDFWMSISDIINEGFTSEGLAKLDDYAEQFSTGKILYKRFSPSEQYGCREGELQLGKIQEKRIESWAKAAGFWISNTDETYEQTLGEKIAQGGEAVVYDNGNKVLKTIGLDYFILPFFALDRISLHNAYFEEREEREEYRF